MRAEGVKSDHLARLPARRAARNAERALGQSKVGFAAGGVDGGEVLQRIGTSDEAECLRVEVVSIRAPAWGATAIMQ